MGGKVVAFENFLTGERIYLREVRLSDVGEQYYSWMNDPEVVQYLETRFHPRSIENITEYVRAMDGKADEPFFAICLNENDKHIGNIKLGPINWQHRHADISLLVGDKACWGKGFATEAIRLVTEFAFGELNLNKLKAGCYGDNQGSAKAFERCGFHREGLLQEHFWSKGEYVDSILLGLTRSKFLLQGKK